MRDVITRRPLLLALAAVVLGVIVVALTIEFTTTTHGFALTVLPAPNATAEVVLDPEAVRREVPALAAAFAAAIERGTGRLKDAAAHEACAFLTSVKPRCFGFVGYEGRTFEISVAAFG